MESRRTRSCVIDNVLDCDIEDKKQQKFGTMQSSYRRVTNPEYNGAGSAIFSDMLKIDKTGHSYRHGYERNNSNLVDNSISRLYKLQSEIGEMLQESGLMVCMPINEKKKQTSLCCGQNLKELKTHSPTNSKYATRKTQEDQRKGIESAQSRPVMPLEYRPACSKYSVRKKEDERKNIENAQSMIQFKYYDHSPVQTLYPAERENVLFKDSVNDNEFRRHTTRTTQHISEISGESRTEHHKYYCLLDDFMTIDKNFHALETNLASLKDERLTFDLKLTDLNRDISILEKQRKALEMTLLTYKEKENELENEMKQFSIQINKFKCELRRYKEFDGTCGASNQSDISTVKNTKDCGYSNETCRPNNPVSKHHAADLHLIQDKRREELHLYKLQLTEAVQHTS
ncbi:hypothetical protein L9F63_005028 [Diploptera punctata]|uniref:Uncharacterized protein n=1 Tax=Diploptera punctata TaxID=6984 RepID=A0AAD7ZDV2_DIPPU|nr:hypothetical protein L9F63_005028 [Diploptera punctata]